MTRKETDCRFREKQAAEERKELVKKCRETVKALVKVMRHERCPILSHRLTEVKHELMWCERTYGE